VAAIPGARFELLREAGHLPQIEQPAATFRAIDAAGMARVDFFLEGDDRIYVNEINTIPGFTSISMVPKMWEYSGIPYSELLDRLIGLALDRSKARRDIRYSR